jgi:hypothetical protein
MADRCSIYPPPARLIAGDSRGWEIADSSDDPSASYALIYAFAAEAGGAVAEVEVEADAPSPIAVAFKVAHG